VAEVFEWSCRRERL